MLRVGDRFVNPKTGASIEVIRAPANVETRLEVRRVLKPGTGWVVPHVHTDYTERFVVESGRARSHSAGSVWELGPGDDLVVRPNERHSNVQNVSDEDLVMRHVFDPVSDFALAYVETLCHLMLQGRTDRQGEVPLSAAFAVADATKSQTFVVGLPHALQRAILAAIGARVALARGYELRLPG
jgi:mannose-6-phosphate isomerase-like protein (cupin superfamily)